MEQMREMLVDPVCGEEIDPEESDYLASYQGELYFFCSLNCQLDFEEAPEKFVGPYA